MADILFPAFEPRLQSQRKALYAALLTDIVRAASDAIDALELFHGLLHGNQHGAQSTGFMAFDAHGGDTGCHLRAGMILEAFTLHYRMSRDQYTGELLAPLWIEENTKSLYQTRTRAREVCQQLTRERLAPSKAGFDARDTHARLVTRLLDWEEKVPATLYEQDYYKCPRIDEGNQVHAPIVETDGLAFGYTSPSSTASVQSPSSTTSYPDYDLSSLRTQWNLQDSKTLLRLIVYSYILSKYKIFFCSEGVIAARLCPEQAAEYGYELMDGLWDFTNTDYRKARVQRIGQEFRALQVWLSDLSCAWLHSLAMRSVQSAPMTSLFLETVQKSGTGLSAAPCYPGFLLLREEMAKESHRIVLIDRHFCSHGVHFNVFLTDITWREQSEDHPRKILSPTNWRIRKTTISELSTQTRSDPHLVVMGNSIQGSTSRYKARVCPPCPRHVHGDVKCPENADHIEKFLLMDHDALALAFFASHRSYSFALQGVEKEEDFVGDKMDGCMTGLRHHWRTMSGRLEYLGGGHGNMQVFGWQHVFLETMDRLAFSLDDWIQRGDLMPLSTGVTAHRIS